MIFERLRIANLASKPKKCHLGQERIKFLGHYVGSVGIEPMPEKCQAVQEFSQPRKVKDVRSFQGQGLVWSGSCEKAFRILKKKLVTLPILAYPDYQQPYILMTDASSEAIGMVVSQIQDVKERVIA